MIDGFKLTFEQERELIHQAYNIAVRKKNNDEEVKLLLNQFYYGIAAQKDLLYKCIELGWIEIPSKE